MSFTLNAKVFALRLSSVTSARIFDCNSCGKHPELQRSHFRS
jgi:hypothetical protein